MKKNTPVVSLAATAMSGGRRRWFALGLLCTTLFIVILDSSVVIVAIPSIETSLALTPDTAQWVISAYAVTFGGLLLFGGRMADVLGRRRVFMAGVAMFALASLGCGLTTSSELLVIARMVQGAAAAVMTPSALSILIATFGEGSERNRALGWWGATGGIGGTAGALIGGPVTDGLGWPWIFFLNVPVCALVLLLSPVLLEGHSNRTSRRAFDVLGATCVTGAALLLVYAVVQAPLHGWASPETVLPLLAALALGGAFLRVEVASADPLIPLRMLRSRTLVGGNLVIAIIGMMVFGGIGFTLTQYGQHILGYSAWQFGLMTSVNAAMAMVGAYLGQRAVTRFGARTVAQTSLLLAVVACAYLTQIDVNGSYLRGMFAGLLIFGCGLGAGTVAGTIAALSGVAENHSGAASALTTAAFQIGGAIGIAVISAAAVWRTSHEHAGTSAAAALTDGYRFGFGVAVSIGVIGLALTHFLLRPTHPDVENTPAAGRG